MDAFMRILIADVSAVSRKLLKHLITHLPNYHIVGEAVNGEDLMDKVVIEKPDIVVETIQ
jgi:two-component system, LytTR family, response regulator